MQQGDIYLVNLEPIQGSENGKTRPCIIISPNNINNNLNTVYIVPLTHTNKGWPTRYTLTKDSFVALDQLRTCSKTRLIKKIGTISNMHLDNILEILRKIFS